ncbi:KduI/IolB family protein [bacterium BMS3Bbin01]|nr:KduI/IolB family protein [bacterium BMS3Bbin01]
MNEAQSELEEIRYLRVDGESGFGSFSCCSTDGEIDDTPRVSDCDVYRVPWGFHGPAAADPRHVMCHLDVLAGPISGTGMASLRGTLHAWVRDALEPLPTDPRLPTTGARPARSPWRDEGAVRLLPHPIERRSAEAT